MSLQGPLSREAVIRTLELLLGEKVEVNERTILEGVAEYQLLLGRIPEGMQALQEAKNLHRKVFDYKGDARVLRRLGRIYHQRGEPQEAVRALQQAASASKEVDDPVGQVLALDLLSRLMQEEKRFPEAIRMQEEMLRLKDAAGDGSAQARTQMQLAAAYASTGRHSEALRSYRAALRYWRHVEDASNGYECLRRIMSCYLLLGRFDDLIRTGGEVLTLLDQSGAATGRHAVYTEIGAACWGIDQYEQAVEAFNNAVAAAREEGNRVHAVQAMVSLGHSLRERGYFQEALRTLREAEMTSRESVRECLGDILAELGITHLANGQVGEARRILTDADKVLKNAQEPDRSCEVLILLAGILSMSGLDAEAEAVLVRGHAMAQGVGDTQLLATVYALRGNVLWQLGRLDEAQNWLQMALDTFEDLAIRRESYQLFGQLMRPYEGLIDIHMKNQQLQQALDVAQRAHGQTAVRAAESLRFAELESGTVAQVEGLLAQLQGAYARLATCWDLSLRRALQEKISDLRMELRKQQEPALQNHPEYAALRFVRTLPMDQAARMLDPEGALLMFFVGRHRSYLWVMTRDQGASYNLNITRQELSAQINALVSALQHKADPSQVVSLSSALSAALVWEAEPLLARCRRLLIIPHDVLFNVPFDALVRRDGTWFATHWDIAVVPTVQLWKLCHGKAKQIWRARATQRVMTKAILEGPAPSAAIRAAEVRQSGGRGLLGGRRLSLAGGPPQPANSTEAEPEDGHPVDLGGALEVGSSLTMEHFDQEGRRATGLHFSMPIDMDPVHPFSTLLHLWDGQVSLQDLALQKLGAQCAFFSAVSTRQDDAVQGPEWMSFFMSMLYAGVPSVVISQWRVHEATRAGMAEAFFRSLQRGSHKAAALRQAQFEMMQSRRYTHPHFWAGFTLYGDWS